jgi:hypothetical protein
LNGALLGAAAGLTLTVDGLARMQAIVPEGGIGGRTAF